MNVRFALVAATSMAAFLFIPTALAQVPGVINYQGRVVVGSTNFNGTGQFSFALVNSNGTVTYWSNDGTSVAGSQPTAALSLAVTNGLYSVALGDISLAGMNSSIPSSVFTNPDVRLRVWFNDLTHGFQLLAPDQRLAASGYALMAGGVNLPATTSATSGTVQMAGTSFLHAYGAGGLNDGNTFAGSSAGNFSLSGTQNAGIGSLSLFHNTTGGFNAATGWGSLYQNTTGAFNTADGESALFANTSGIFNIGIGRRAGYNLTTGIGNIDIGNFNYNTGLSTDVSGESNTIRIGAPGVQTATYVAGIYGATSSGGSAVFINSNGQLGTAGGSVTLSGDLNLPATTSAAAGVLNLGGAPFLHAYGVRDTFVGQSAGNFATNGQNNTGVGYSTLSSNTSGSANTAVGDRALTQNSSGFQNTAVGDQALFVNTTASANVAVGVGALTSQSFNNNNTAWNTFNTAVGFDALSSNNPNLFSNGINNTAVGAMALSGNTIGVGNTANGYKALLANTTGNFNAAFGDFAISSNTVGSENTAMGDGALSANTTASQNVALGAGALAVQSFSNGGSAWNSNNVAVGYAALQLNQPSSTSNGIQNTAVGASALSFNTVGTDNVSVGYQALNFNSTAGQNVAVGSGALYTQSYASNGSWSSDNVAVGFQALYSNQPSSPANGNYNTALGALALSGNTVGSANTASGFKALLANAAGNSNAAFGTLAISSNTLGSQNTAVGDHAMGSNTTAGQNVAIGSGALQNQSFSNSNTAWNSNNVAVGYQALYNNQPAPSQATGISGINNVATGTQTLFHNTTGSFNVANGEEALFYNSSGSSNIGIGNQALNSNQTGSNNVAVGSAAHYSLQTGSNNIAIGTFAGYNLIGGSNNIDIGYSGPADESNIIRIGDGSTQTDTYLTGTVHAPTSVGVATTPTHARFEVGSTAGSFTVTSTNAQFDANSTTLGHLVPGTYPAAIYANGPIVTVNNFVAVSDARTKVVLGQSDGRCDLAALQAIAITDFRYKDVLTHDNAVHKKVIAQQVETVYPQAVSRSTDEIPDIYQKATIQNGWVQLTTDLQVGDRVKLIGDREQGVYEVREVTANAFRTDFNPAGNVVFVYGREVKDFRSVDYDAISMLNVSATQELARQLKTAQQENAALTQRLTDLESRLTRLEQNVK